MLVVNMKTSKGLLDFELFDEDAPQTVAHFRGLVQGGFYNGLEFFKHVPNTLVQTGCPNNDGTGHSGYFIKCELDENQRKHDFGTLSMAHTARNCNGSQFFICLNRSQGDIFDQNHTCFGKLLKKGFDVVPKLRVGDKIIKMTIEETE